MRIGDLFPPPPSSQGKYMDIEFDYKGDPVGGIISNCKYFHALARSDHFIALFPSLSPTYIDLLEKVSSCILL